MGTSTADIFYLAIAIIFFVFRNFFNAQYAPPTQKNTHTGESSTNRVEEERDTQANMMSKRTSRQRVEAPSTLEHSSTSQKIHTVNKQKYPLYRYGAWKKAIISKEILQPYAHKI